MGVTMVAARKQVHGTQGDTFDLDEKIKEFDKSLEKFNEIPLSLPYTNDENHLESDTVDLDVEDVEEEMSALAESGHEEPELSQSMINETGSCPDMEKNESCSGWYGLIPEDDSIYQVQLPTFSEHDESLENQVHSKQNIFISESKTPARSKPNHLTKQPIKKHRRRGSMATFLPPVKHSSVDNTDLVQTWLDTKFDKKSQVKKPSVPRGMLALADGEDLSKPEEGVFKRKIHPKYANINEDRSEEINEENLNKSEEIKEAIQITGRKRKREVDAEDNTEVMPNKRSRTGRWQWVSKWLPKWVSEIFGITK